MIDKKIVIGVASDHAGYPLKKQVLLYLEENGYTYKDYGCFSEERCDYPDYAHMLAHGIEKRECAIGIGICGSGEGISMALNKHAGIRAALCWTPEIAHMSRLHNDANVLVMPGRYIDKDESIKIMEQFFHTNFEGGRHIERIKKIPINPM